MITQLVILQKQVHFWFFAISDSAHRFAIRCAALSLANCFNHLFRCLTRIKVLEFYNPRMHVAEFLLNDIRKIL